MNADQSLRDQFRDRRKARGSQRKAADEIGVSLRTIQNFEAGNGDPQPANLRKMLTWAGLSLDTQGDVTLVERAWPADVSVFLDVMGAYLMRFDEEERLRVIYSVTRQIFEAGQ